jgi:hypothetical protein
MERVLLEAPQFAHHSITVMGHALDGLYSDVIRDAGDGRYDDDKAVPSGVVAAHRDGYCPQLFVAGPTASFISDKVGFLCVACGATQYSRSGYLTPGFCNFFCPSALRWKGREAEESVSFLCGRCDNTLCLQIRKLRGDFSTLREEVSAEELVWSFATMAANNNGFRKRVSNHAPIWSRCRFDPRRPHPLQALEEEAHERRSLWEGSEGGVCRP